MDDDAIRDIAAQLEGAARIEDARFRLDEIWDDNDAVADHIIANRVGFLYLASLLLRGAVAEEDVAFPSLIALGNENAEAFFDKTERREKWQSDPVNVEGSGNVFWEGVGCYSSIAIVLFFVVIGAITVWKWIF